MRQTKLERRQGAARTATVAGDARPWPGEAGLVGAVLSGVRRGAAGLRACVAYLMPWRAPVRPATPSPEREAIAWLTDPSGACVFLSHGWVEYTGQPVAEALGWGWMQRLRPDDANAMRRGYERIATRREPLLDAYPLRARDDSWNWVAVTGAARFDAAGVFLGYGGSLCRAGGGGREDDTARQRLLLEATQQILESPDSGAVLIDALFARIRDYFELDICLNYRLSESGGTMQLELCRGVSESWRILAATLAPERIACPAAGHGCQPGFDDRQCRGCDPAATFLHDLPDVRARICLPLMSADGAVMGVLAFASTRREAFEARDTAFFQALSHFVGIAWERERARRALSESEQRFRRAVGSAPLPIVIHAEDGEILFVNDCWVSLSGYARDEMPTLEAWQNRAFDGDGSLPVVVTRTRVRGEAATGGERTIRCKDGSQRVWCFSASALGWTPDGRRSVIRMAVDLTERKKVEAEAAFLASHDRLTGLPNRLLAHERFSQALGDGARRDENLALLFLDIDNFKAINDTLGHEVGDRLLQAFAQRLSGLLSRGDNLCRQGGDEFLLLLGGGRSIDEIAQIADALLLALAQPFDVGEHALAVSASIGIALFPVDADTLDGLMSKADMALYEAKGAGRNTCRFYAEWMNAATALHLAIRNELSGALAGGQFEIYYQPQLRLGDYAVLGVEALLRWHSPTRGMVAPGLFISIAEETGQIEQIGAWVLEHACRQAAQWRRDGVGDLVVAVNISAVQFRRGDLVGVVKRALEVSGLASDRLELELTESILIRDTRHVLETVHQLKAMGVCLSIDDFGTGYSSLAYLKQFPADKLKIDKSFVSHVAESVEDAALVEAILRMAQTFGLVTIAEGVETEAAIDHLRARGCDLAQGYYFARPMPAAQIPEFVRAMPRRGISLL